MKTAEFGKRLYLIGDEHKKQTDTRVCEAEKSDDLAFFRAISVSACRKYYICARAIVNYS